jgi:hypothetical protein
MVYEELGTMVMDYDGDVSSDKVGQRPPDLEASRKNEVHTPAFLPEFAHYLCI